MFVAAIVFVLSEAIKPFLRPAREQGYVTRAQATVARVLLALFLVWLYMGHPLPSFLQPRDDPRLDQTHWYHASTTGVMYKWWQFGTLGVDTVMPVPACVHYDRARLLQEELERTGVIVLPSEPTQTELLGMSPLAAKERALRYAAVINSTLDARDQCFMTAREEHLLLTATMPYLTTDTMAPSLIDFVRASPHRDALLSAPSDGRVDDVLVSRLGETFARVVAIVKQAATTKHEAYTLALKRVLLPLGPYMQTLQSWYDDQINGAVIKVPIDPCKCPALDGIFRSGLYAYYDKRSRRYSLLARMHISERNEYCQGECLWAVEQMPFVDYLNPHPAHVYRRLPESLRAPFAYPLRFQVAYYNLSAVIHDYHVLQARMRDIMPYTMWLPLVPDTSASVDHVPLAIAPLNKLVGESKVWVDQEDVTQCIMFCDRLEDAILRSAMGEPV